MIRRLARRGEDVGVVSGCETALPVTDPARVRSGRRERCQQIGPVTPIRASGSHARGSTSWSLPGLMPASVPTTMVPPRARNAPHASRFVGRFASTIGGAGCVGSRPSVAEIVMPASTIRILLEVVIGSFAIGLIVPAARNNTSRDKPGGASASWAVRLLPSPVGAAARRTRPCRRRQRR
jgi:hypothetical protein